MHLLLIFAVYPVAVPMFRKANVSKLLMPAIFLYGAVVLNVVTPGAPSMLCIALSEKLGVTTFAAPNDGNCAPCSGFRLRHFLLHLGLQLPARPWNWLCSL